jgi:hypothetical protein
MNINNIDNQLDAKITAYLNMFRAIILPIFRNIPQAVTHSLVLLKMGKIIARYTLS